mgnify:CR=1 FL=1|jgi:hypothetical protein|tara:strand:+ start:33297 stop:33974 length:678 start_codon:yes stop_codon:yes gene_type:complete
MDSFLKRLKYYGIGFSMGLIFVIFFFQNRGCSWTPTNRIKTSILERIVVIPDSEKGFNTKDKELQKELLNYIENGEVDFGKSKKKDPNKFYKFDLKGQKSLYFTLPNDSFISAVYRSEPKHETIKGKARLLLFPEIEDLIFMDTTDLLSCQLLGLGFKDERQLQKELIKNGVIDFNQSSFKDVVKPEHFVEILTPKGNKMALKAVWYKSKINIKSFSYTDSLNCM